MAHGDFVWCDLSARHLEEMCAFYEHLFNWKYLRSATPDGSDYRIAQAVNPVAGLFAMPEKFDEMGMPCFWMSYIEVASIKEAIEIAKSHGGRVELGPIPGGMGSKVALIRDPLGAGFTVIEGKGLQTRTANPRHGDMAWNALYLSDAEAVIPFYEALFGWIIEPADSATGEFDVTINGRHGSAIHQIPDAIRGREQYWGVHFAVDDLLKARSVAGETGALVYEEDGLILACDPDNAAFFMTGTVSLW